MDVGGDMQWLDISELLDVLAPIAPGKEAPAGMKVGAWLFRRPRRRSAATWSTNPCSGRWTRCERPSQIVFGGGRAPAAKRARNGPRGSSRLESLGHHNCLKVKRCRSAPRDDPAARRCWPSKALRPTRAHKVVACVSCSLPNAGLAASFTKKEVQQLCWRLAIESWRASRRQVRTPLGGGNTDRIRSRAT